MASSIETLILEIIARDKGASDAFNRLARQIDQTSGSLDKNSASLAKNQKAQVSALGGAIGLGVAVGAMAVPLLAAGAGFTAFAGVAIPSITAVTAAMTGTGGLMAAWGTLDKSQRNAALGVQFLDNRYSALAKTMEPQVFQVFNSGLKLANSLLGPTGQLAASAGHGIETFLVQFTANSGLQQFIGFLAKQAGPAIALLGRDVTGIAHAVFALLQSFGGVGMAELKVFTTVLTGLTTSISWLATHTGPLTNVALAIGGIAFALSKFGLLSGAMRLTGLTLMAGELGAVAGAAKGATIAEKGLLATNAILDSITPFGWALLAAAAVGGLVFWLSRAKTAADNTVTSIEAQNKAVGFNTAGYLAAAAAIGKVNEQQAQQMIALRNTRSGIITGYESLGKLTGVTDTYNAAQNALIAGARQQTNFLQILQAKYGLTAQQAAALAKAAGILVDKNGKLKDGLQNSVTQAEAYAKANLNAQGPTSQLAADMQDFANKTLTATARTTALTNALKLFFDPAVTADQDLITLKNDAAALATALAASSGKTGLLTATQRTARSAFDTYIGQVATAASDAFAATGKTSSYNNVVKASLPILQAAAGGNKALRKEIQDLINTLKGGITEKVTGIGSWTITSGGGVTQIRPPGTTGAAGMLVRGGIPGKDSVPILAMPGEVLVPVNMVRAGAVDHLRGQLPGFASGGVVGSYGPGSVGGLSGWVNRENIATLTALERGVANAVLAGIQSASMFAAGGPGGGAPAANAALARRMMPAWASGPAWSAWNYVAMRESGWNQFAWNPSGAYGIPQALPFSKMPKAAWPPWAGGSANPAAQIGWMIGYINSVYGSPQNAAGHEAAFNWYDRGGFLPPGLSLALNTTGRPEPVGMGGNVIINVTATPLAHPADVGRAVVGAIQAYENRSGTAWRKGR